MSTAAESSPKPPRRRRRRWLLRVPIILAATAVTVGVLAQVFLWTDYPRRIAEAQVENILHVRTSIRSVKIGWLGHTHIEGVTLALPMEREPFLNIKTIDVEHASLPLIAFDQELSDVKIDGIDLAARQDVNGRWNLQQLLPPSSPTTTNPTTTRRTNPLADLPSLHATNVHVSLTRTDGKTLALPILSADLQKHAPLSATFSGKAGDAISVEGELAQNASLSQSLHVSLKTVPAEVASFFGVTAPAGLAAVIDWEGRLTGTGIAGTMKLVDAHCTIGTDLFRAIGTVDVQAGDGGVIARPTQLALTIGNGAKLDLRANAGRITFDRSLSVEGVAGTLNGGRFVADGSLDPATSKSDLTARWEQVTSNSFATTGSASLQTSRLFNGKIKIDAELRGGAKLPTGEAVGAAMLSGEGGSIDSFAGTVKLDPLTWTPSNGDQPIVTPRLRGEITSAGSAISVGAQTTDDAAHSGSITASASFDRAKLAWWMTFDAGGLKMPAIEARGIKGPVDVSVAASGTLSHIDVAKAYAKLDKLSAFAAGSAELAAPGTMRASVWTWYEKPQTEDEAAELNSLSAVTNVRGNLFPRDLSADVDLTGNELVFAGRKFGDVSLQLTASIDANEANFRTQEMELLGGRWSLRGHWSGVEGGPPVLVAHFRDMPAENLGRVIGREDLKGTFGGEAKVHVRSSRLDQLDMTATVSGANLSAGPVRVEGFDAAATLKRGRFEITPTLHEAGGTIAANVQSDVLLTQPLTATITLTDWPAPYVESTAVGAQRFRPRASGMANAQFSVRTGDVSGDVALTGTIERDDAKLADFNVKGSVANKLIDITQFAIGTLDGSLDATAKLNLADYNASVIAADFKELKPARLDWSNPSFAEVPGKLNGTFSVRPSKLQRPIGPLEVELNVRPEDTSFRGVRIGDISLLAFADLKTTDDFRFVTDNAVFNIAGGRIEPFLRLSCEPERGIAQLITAKFSNVDLGEVVKAADDDGKDLVGKVGGTVSLYGQTTNLKTLTGEATLNITDSDLANFGPISALYNVLAVGTAGSKPIGEGSVSLRVESDTLTIEDGNYFNRGVYASAFGPIRNISEGTGATMDRPIVVGSLQPLRAVKLPFFGDLNDTLSALQSSVTAIEVTGTLKDPKMQQVSLGALGDTFQKLLMGKARGDGK